jgi:predicted unusual protein kinase regulating ubiquinone biosynthesis (AarF/ABC1/UbiB family)
MIQRFLKIVVYFTSYSFFKLTHQKKQASDLIYRAVNELGGMYVKLIQFICLRTDIFAESDKLRFLRFYDAVPVQLIDINNFLSRSLGPDCMDNFQYIEPSPFASGTFGQVYRGKLQDGTDIVVKVLRQGVRKNLIFDFFLLRICAVLFNLLFYQTTIDVWALLHEFETLTFQELDYLEEAKNAEYFYHQYMGHPHVVIPKTYLMLCAKNILVQEYIGGVSVTDLIRNTNGYTQNLRPFMFQLAYELGLQGFLFDKFYADPHPGNIKILPNGMFAFIDFGIVGHSPNNRRNYYHIIELLIANADNMDTKQVGKEFLEWGAERLNAYLAQLDDQISSGAKTMRSLVIDKYARALEAYRNRFRQIEAIEEENFSKMYLDIIHAGEVLGVKIPEGMLATMRSIAIYKSWVTYLDPEYHMMRDVYKHIIASVDKKHLYN